MVQAQAMAEDDLKKLDWIVVIDHSGSTGEPSLRLKGRTRFDEMHESCLAVARQAERYDDDGITVITFSGRTKVFDGVTGDKVKNVFAEIHPGGGTNLGAAIREVMAKKRASTKDVIAIIYTDGEADSETDVIAALNDAGKEFGRPKIAFVIVQIGEDAGAKKFLDRLDNGLAVDVLATVRAEDADELSVPELAWLGRNA